MLPKMQNPNKNFSRPLLLVRPTEGRSPFHLSPHFPAHVGQLPATWNPPRLLFLSTEAAGGWAVTQFCHRVAPKEVKVKTKLQLEEEGTGRRVTLLAASTLAQTASMAARSSSRFCFFSFALLDFLCNREKQSWLEGCGQAFEEPKGLSLRPQTWPPAGTQSLAATLAEVGTAQACSRRETLGASQLPPGRGLALGTAGSR